MARLLLMPEVAANATEAVLAEWHVAEKESFTAGATLAAVETEKALVDVEAEADGVVLTMLVTAGAQVLVGAPIAVLGAPGEDVDDLEALLAELGVQIENDPVRPPRRDVPEPGQGLLPDPEGGTAETAAQPALEVPVAERQPVRRPGERVFSSPLARRLAREAGLPVEEIDGTGPRNRILRRDVERALSGRSEQRAAPVATNAAPASTVPAAGGTAFDDLPHSRVRRATAARLLASKQTAPHFYLRATLRADRLLALRAELNDGAEVSVSVNDLLVKAVAAAHVRVPEMNVIWTDDAVRRFHGVDLALAVATERGLMTPVLRDVTSLSITEVARQVRDLADRARAGRLRQDDLEGGSMSISNLGMFGTEEFAAIINPPHASILAVGAVREEPVVDDGTLAVGHVLRVTLSVDHRPVDGVVAARWMAAFGDLVEHPVRILA